MNLDVVIEESALHNMYVMASLRNSSHTTSSTVEYEQSRVNSCELVWSQKVHESNKDNNDCTVQ